MGDIGPWQPISSPQAYVHDPQIIDLVETYREIANAVTDTYVSVVSNPTNDSEPEEVSE